MDTAVAPERLYHLKGAMKHPPFLYYYGPYAFLLTWENTVHGVNRGQVAEMWNERQKNP